MRTFWTTSNSWLSLSHFSSFRVAQERTIIIFDVPFRRFRAEAKSHALSNQCPSCNGKSNKMMLNIAPSIPFIMSIVAMRNCGRRRGHSVISLACGNNSHSRYQKKCFKLSPAEIDLSKKGPFEIAKRAFSALNLYRNISPAATPVETSEAN